MSTRTKIRTVLMTALFATASGVVLADVPEERFALARAAIEEAQEVDADVSPSSELSQAESKFQEAVEYNDRGREEPAERLLHQSMLHAELAEIEGMQAKADVAFTEVNAALRSLELEIGRR